MRVYVDELPKSKNDCPFYCQKTDQCRVCGTVCHIEDCKCLAPLVVVVDEAEGESEDESDNQEI